MDIEAWLRGLRLEQYAPAFRDNHIDAEVLPKLTADDLISIGVTSVGHRRKLFTAITAVRDEPTISGEQSVLTAAQTAKPASSDPRPEIRAAGSSPGAERAPQPSPLTRRLERDPHQRGTR